MKFIIVCLGIFLTIPLSVQAHGEKCHWIFLQEHVKSFVLREIAAIPFAQARTPLIERLRPLQSLLRANESSTNDVMSRLDALEVHESSGYTAQHSWAVGMLATKFGLLLGLSDEDAIDLFYAGLAHDLGKLTVPEEILNKPKLSSEEFALIKKHAASLYTLLQAELPTSPRLQRYVELGVTHHERWDGNGYPGKIRSGTLDLPAQVLIFADTFHAMITNRSYQKAKTIEVAIAELLNEKDRGQFDPALVEKMAHIIQSEL